MGIAGLYDSILTILPSRCVDYLNEVKDVHSSTFRKTSIFVVCGVTVMAIWKRYRGTMLYNIYAAEMPMIHEVIPNEKAMIKEELERMKGEHDDNLRILEIGVGSGENFEVMPDGTHLTIVEPLAEAHDKVRKKLESLKFEKKLNIHLDATHLLKAENMSLLQDNSFDVVLITYVFCSVNNIGASLKEIRRILKPGGKMLSIDHVSSSSWKLYTLQVLFYPVSVFIESCDLIRNPLNKIKNTGFRDVKCHEFTMGLGGIGFLFSPHIYCIAEK